MELGKAIRQEFMLNFNRTCLNHGSHGAVTRRAFEAKKRLSLEFEAEPDQWFLRLDFNYYQENIAAAAELVGADPRNIVFMNNSSTGLNTVLKNLPLNSNDAILISKWTYRWMKNTVQWVSEKSGAEIIQVDIKVPIESKESVIEEFRKTIEKHGNIKLAVVDGVTSMPSVLMPFKEITQLCQDQGIIVLVDGAHTPGHIPLELEKLGADFFVGNLHKWAYASRGCAILYIKPKHHAYIDPLVTSANMHHEDIHVRFHYQGTSDCTTFFAVKYALSFIKDIGGLETATVYNTELIDKAIELATRRWGTGRMDIPRDMEAPFMRQVHLPVLKKFPVIQEIPGDISTSYGNMRELSRVLLEKFNIVVNCIYLQNEPYVRLSANIYNCFEDYEKLVDAIVALKAEEEE